MEFILSIISETVIGLVVLFLGAAVRWLFLFRKRSFASVFNEEDEYKNSITGIITLITIILSVILLK